MITNYIRAFMIVFVLWLFSGCTKHSDKVENTSVSKIEASSLDASAEINKWKKDLIKNKTIGTPCFYESIDDPKAATWNAENPDQMDGLPIDDKEIMVGKSDLNGDGAIDLFLYFNARNCTGHNGGTPSFAKIIYSDSAENSAVVDDITAAILEEYNRKRTIDDTLIEVTDTFLREKISISFSTQITGKFFLYANGAPHCCPSYEGKYSYNPAGKKIDFQLTELKY